VSFARALALAATLAFAPAARAAANYQVLGHDDAWEVGTGTDGQGNAYCSIQDQSPDQSQGLLLITYPLGDAPSFELHAFKDSWSIPGNADVQTTFNFSDGGSWNADGEAASDGSSVVDYTIDVRDMRDFLNDFSQSSRLDIVFAKGTEPTWTTNLSGTSKATADLLSCTDKLLGTHGGGATQPYNPPDSTPPDSSPPDNSTPPPGNSQTI
jgi:hypothetical protein